MQHFNLPNTVNLNKAIIGGNTWGITSNLLKSNNPYAKPILLKCFKHNKVGHRSSDCLRRKSVNIIERKEEDIIEEEVYYGPNEEDDKEVYGHGEYTCVVKKLMLSQMNEDITQ